jgi:5'-nucleotidase
MLTSNHVIEGPANIRWSMRMAAGYYITVSNFLAGCGQNFMGFTAGTELLTGMINLDAFEDYHVAHSPIAPATLYRIIVIQ